MKRERTETDNSHFNAKALLRAGWIEDGESVSVLDCFHGSGKVWDRVGKLRPKANISLLGIDKKKTSRADFIGDNVKFMRNLDLSRFDIVDLDAYGWPVDQLEILSSLGYSGRIFITVNSSGNRSIPSKVLQSCGFGDNMASKCPSLFNRFPFEKLRAFLFGLGVRRLEAYEYIEARTESFYARFRIHEPIKEAEKNEHHLQTEGQGA